VRIDAGEPEGEKPCARLEAQAPGSLLGHEQHRRGAVDDLARVARRDLAARNEGGLELGQLLGARVATDGLVRVDEDPDVRVRDLDRHDLALEPALVDRAGGAAVGLERVLVQLLARQVPAFGHLLGGDALRDDLPPLADDVREAAAVGAHRHAGHRLDAAGDHDVELAGPDRRARVEARLHRRTALTLDRAAGDGVGPSGGQRREAGDVPRLLVDLGHAAELHVLDLGRIEAGAVGEAVQDLGGEVVAAQGRQGAVPLADRTAKRLDDQGIRLPRGHAMSLAPAL
jgi:hypothetical protein